MKDLFHYFDIQSLSVREYFHVIENGIDFQEQSIINIPYQPTRWIVLKWDEQHYVGPFTYEKPEVDSEANYYKIHFRAERNLHSRESFPVITIGNERVMVARLSNEPKISSRVEREGIAKLE